MPTRFFILQMHHSNPCTDLRIQNFEKNLTYYYQSIQKKIRFAEYV